MFKVQFFLLIFLFLIAISSLINSEQIKKEFIINDYIKLKLENGRTSIYVKNRVFRQCMYLLLNIPVKKIEEYDDIESIDEAAEKLDRSLEGRHSTKSIITPEVEFKGHCSNIQAWAENDYDTRILHRNLAFPLLKRLSEVGDPLAKKKIKEEIAIRYASGYPSVTTFLTKNGYLKYLNSEEIACLIDDQNLPIIKKISEKLKLLIDSTENDQLERPILSLIKKLSQNFGLHNLPFIISRIIKKIPEDSKQRIVKIVYNKFENNKKFPLIEFLNYTLEFFKEIEFDHVTCQDKLIGIIRNKTLNLTEQDIENITDIKGLEKKYSIIEELDLSHNRIREIKGLENFINLKVLNLNHNQITHIEGLDHLKKLQKLFL
ncbi:MAG: leucine-rich repeat domain-containing protein, partial [Promethearchaeota archaeon]